MSGFGVDRLSLSFLVDDYERDPTAWDRRVVSGEGTPLQSEARSITVDGVYVAMKELPTGTWGKVECNPSRLVDPDGASLCPVAELPTAAAAAWRATEGLLRPGCPIGDAKTKRLDVARDFVDVEDPAFYIGGLVGLRRRWAREQYAYNDPARGHALTLSVGSGSGLTRLYNNHEAKPDKAAKGSVRWEAECRGGWSERYGNIKNLRDVNEQSIETLGKNRWEWSGMGAEVAATDRVLEKVLRSGLSPTKQYKVLGMLLASSRGRPLSMGKNQASEYSRIVRELGVVLSPDLFEGGSGAGFVGRLDLESGREVLRVA